MKIEENISLKEFTTFKIGGPAKYFVRVKDATELPDVIKFAQEKNLEIFVLGGGSNVLVSDEGFDGLVIHPEMSDIEIVSENDDSVSLKLGAAEVWDKAVEFSVEQNFWGIENLSHIPGNCAAVAVQNVGAYGQEISNCLQSVEVFDRETLSVKILENKDCNFTYRKSIFNTDQKGRFIILSLTIVLSKKPNPNLSYGDVKKYFEGKENPSLAEIRVAIIKIRDSKFPFPVSAVNGNAGSFFRGPIISESHIDATAEKIGQEFGAAAKEKLLSMKDRLRVAQGYKTPTAFFMELAGLKGFQLGGAKVNEPQPAIVLNVTGEATAKEVLELRDYVLNTIKEKFNVELEVEPEMVGF